MKYKINEQKCTGCGACVNRCPEAIEIKSNNKVSIIDQEKLEKCDGESICPFGVIERIGTKEKREKESVKNKSEEFSQFGMGQDGGKGKGRGRGFGRGPKDGRGGGKGFGKK